MKDGTRPVEPTSRQELYEAYVNCYLQPCTEVRPCHDARLLKNAAQYLVKEPEPGGIFTVFPFYQAVSDGRQSLGTDSRKHLSAFIKATELLETLCINLFVQPWKKEIKTLKTFTGPFVYCLLPVLSSSTIKSVLASIGYLPHADTPQRLSEDANPERAMLLGFELLLARVECYHFLELVEKDQLGQQVRAEIKRGIYSSVLFLQLPLYLGTRLTMKPQPKPQQCHLISVDQSIMEMQITYPDLAFRGRPLIPDKPHSANSSRSTSKDDHIATDNHSDDGKVAGPPKRDCIKGTKAAASTAYRKNDGSKDDEVFVDNGSDYRTSGGTTTLGTTATGSFSNGDRSRLDDELNGPQALSLHITLRAGSTAGQSLKTGEQQAAAGDTHTHTLATSVLLSVI
uniref:Uncharacterized LOC113131454 n=1 Tax=Mastacembelus armatus TaxID=205130 RepID=A0A7N8X469_9TELE